MARYKNFTRYRPDIERLREVRVQHSPVQGEVIIPANLRTEVVEYIEALESLIDERLGRQAREVSPLTAIQLAAVAFEIEGATVAKRYGLTAKDVADKLTEAGLTDPDDVITEDTIDRWRKIPAYRKAYIDGLVAEMCSGFLRHLAAGTIEDWP